MKYRSNIDSLIEAIGRARDELHYYVMSNDNSLPHFDNEHMHHKWNEIAIRLQESLDNVAWNELDVREHVYEKSIRRIKGEVSEKTNPISGNDARPR